MKTLLIFILAGCAVRCEDNNYYVIEIPDELRSKTFKVYWNVPTMQCTSKKVHFQNLYERFGIIQNDNDKFKGEKVTIMYDPGLFPALFKNESSGRFRFRNGGVPQEGDLEKHLLKFKQDLEESVPDENFSGVGIIDFESWRPVFRQNFGTLQPYKDVSYQIERALHPWWSKGSIEAEARRRFGVSARRFMEASLAGARALRPAAAWGFYGFPYCFNMAANHRAEGCAKDVPRENDQIQWLWSKSTALYPSLYSFSELTSSQLASLIRGRIREAARHNPGQILPYFWYRYRDGGFLKENDLNVALSTIYNSAATGIIIWGSSNDVNTFTKCSNLLDYIENTFGPAIAKYTKPKRFNDETNDRYNDIFNTTQIINNATENPNENHNEVMKLDHDPDFHWDPPENYTEDIKKHVEEEIGAKQKQNCTNSPVLQNDYVMEWLLNYVLNDNSNRISENNIKDENKTSDVDLISTTEISSIIEITSHVENKIITNNPIDNELSDVNTQINIVDITSTEGAISYDTTTTQSLDSNLDDSSLNISGTEPNLYLETIDYDTTPAKESTVTPDYELGLDADDRFFNWEGFSEEFTTPTEGDFTTETNIEVPTTDSINLKSAAEQQKHLKKVTSNQDYLSSDSTEHLETDDSNDLFTTDNSKADRHSTIYGQINEDVDTTTSEESNTTEITATTNIDETNSTSDYESIKDSFLDKIFRAVQAKSIASTTTIETDDFTTELDKTAQERDNFDNESVTESALQTEIIRNNDLLETSQSNEDFDVTLSPVFEKTSIEDTTLSYATTEQVDQL